MGDYVNMAWFNFKNPFKRNTVNEPGKQVSLNPGQDGSRLLDAARLQLYREFAGSLGLNPTRTVITEKEFTMCEKIIPGFSNPKKLLLAHPQAQNPAAAHQVASALGAIYTKVSTSRIALMRDIQSIEDFYLVDTIINRLCEDTLTPDPQTGEIIEISSPKRKDIQVELDYLNDRYKLDRLISSILPDVIKYGEYTLSTSVRNDPKVYSESLTERSPKPAKDFDDSDPGPKKYGLLELNDTVDQTQVIPITKDHEIDFYLKASATSNYTTRLEVLDRTTHVQFSLNQRKKRIDLWQEFNNSDNAVKDIIEQLPRFVRLGKSVLHPVIGKIKELELLEKLIPATKLAKLSRGTVLGVPVEEGYEIKDAIQLMKRIEGILNKKMGVDTSTDQLLLEEIIASAASFKCIPLFGGDKGDLRKLDVNPNEPDDLLSTVTEIRSTILSSMGIPPELIYGNQSPEQKSEILKRYATYLRMLKNLQASIVDGIKQMISIHLAAVGIKWREDEIDISFRNTIIEIDQLDRLEFQDTVVQMMSNLKTFVTELADPDGDSPIADHVDVSVFAKKLAESLNPVGLDGLVSEKPIPASRRVKSDNMPPSTLGKQDKYEDPMDDEDDDITVDGDDEE